MAALRTIGRLAIRFPLEARFELPEYRVWRTVDAQRFNEPTRC
jgi:hypothetical protein